MVKNLPPMQETWVDPWDGKIPWRRERLSTPVFLPGKSCGQRNLAGYSPWGRRDMTEYGWVCAKTLSANVIHSINIFI